MEVLSKSRLGRYAALKLKKHREETHLFLVEGEKSVEELTGVFEPEALVATAGWWEKSGNESKTSRFQESFKASTDQMRRLTSMATPPQVIGVFHMRPEEDVQIDTNSLYIALDGIQDPGNMGTIIRTADWFGVRTIFASPTTVDVYNAKTVQATMGSLARVEVVYTDLPKLFSSNTEMPIYGTLLDGENIYNSELTPNGFIVMGNEGNGLSEEVRQCVSSRLLLPPYPVGSEHAESLNVGVATALVVAEFRRRLYNSKNG